MIATQIPSQQAAVYPVANAITPDLQIRLDVARKDIKEGRGTLCRTKEELDAFFAEL